MLDSAFPGDAGLAALRGAGKVGVVIEPNSVYEGQLEFVEDHWAHSANGRICVAFKGWFDRGIAAGGASGHVAGTNSLAAAFTLRGDPWLGMWTTLTRETKQGSTIYPQEQLSREQAIRLYTINNAWLNFQEKQKGSLEVGKLADLIRVGGQRSFEVPGGPESATPRCWHYDGGRQGGLGNAKLPVLPGPEMVVPTAITVNVTNTATPPCDRDGSNKPTARFFLRWISSKKPVAPANVASNVDTVATTAGGNGGGAKGGMACRRAGEQSARPGSRPWQGPRKRRMPWRKSRSPPPLLRLPRETA